MRVGILGLGFMGSTHLQALSRIPGAELAAVMDMDEARLSGDLSKIAGNLGGPGEMMDFTGVRQYNSVEGILADPNVEAVDICLPAFLHAQVAIEALRAGKHVLVEKPMALDADSAQRVLAEAAHRPQVLMAAQVLRFLPAYEGLISLVKSGRLGAIRSALFRRRTSVPTWGPWEFDKQKSGGGIFDLLIHDVDMSLLLFGVPRAISATGYEDMQNGVDIITADFRYPAIGSVTITGGWHHVGAYPFSMEYTVIGSEGVVEFSSDGRPPTVYWADGKKEALEAEETDPYQAEIEYFLDCCRENRYPERCPPEDSWRAVTATQMMVEAREMEGEELTCLI